MSRIWFLLIANCGGDYLEIKCFWNYEIKFKPGAPSAGRLTMLKYHFLDFSETIKILRILRTKIVTVSDMDKVTFGQDN